MPEIPMGSQLYIPRGLDSVTGVVHSTALDYDTVESQSGGQDVSFILETITSSSELMKKLNIKASASFKGAWGVSAEFNLINSKEVNSYYTYFLIRCIVINPPKTIRNARWKPDAWQLLERKGWEAFTQTYGHEYVDGTKDGGSYFALLEFQTTNETDSNNVKLKLSGYVGTFEASTTFEADVKQIQKTTVLNISVTRAGGKNDVVGTTFDEMLNEARNFSATAGANPVVFSALTAEYINSVPIPDIPPPDSLVRQQQRDTLDDLGHAYLRLRDYKANLEFVLTCPLTDFDEFRELDAAGITAKQQEFRKSLEEVGRELEQIDRRGEDCASNIHQCQPYTFHIQLLELPKIGGELLNIKQMEEKLAALEKVLSDRALPGGNLQLPPNSTISAPGRLNVAGDELLFLLNRQGVVISRAGQGNGNLSVDGSVAVAGDVAVGGKHALRGNDPWLRLNQDGAFTEGVHTPGLFYPGSLAVGGGPNPGSGNATISGDIRVAGRIGTTGHAPDTPGFGGGVHTSDVVAEGGIYVGPGATGDEKPIQMYNSGDIWARSVHAPEKHFDIPHPIDPTNRRLVHACIEGPENAVLYRGEGQLRDGAAVVELPGYFEALVRPEGRTVLVTPVCDTNEPVSMLAASPVDNGRVEIRAIDRNNPHQRFYWEVKAVRGDVDRLQAEPLASKADADQA